MKTKLIQALREAAKRIATGDEYDWHSSVNCNCGILASCIVRRELSIDDVLHESCYGAWTDKANSIQRCEVTGMPLNEVFRELEKAGLPSAEWGSVEFCDNAKVLKRMGVTRRLHRSYKTAKFVARYFTAWADMLEEESQPVIPTTTQDQIATIEARDVLMENEKQLEPA